MRTNKIDWLEAWRRARKNAWAKLNGGNSHAKLPLADPRHEKHAQIMARVKAGILAAIERQSL